MRQVPDTIAAALNDFESNTPQFFADFFLEDGPEKVLSSQADWAGVGDAAAGGAANIGADGLVTYSTIDTNLTVNDNAGVLQLAAGAAHALFAGAVTGKVGSIQYQVTVRDNYSNHWLWGYKHLSATRTVIVNDPALYYYFTAPLLMYFQLLTIVNFCLGIAFTAIPLIVLDPRIRKREDWPRGPALLIGMVLAILGNLTFYVYKAVAVNYVDQVLQIFFLKGG